MRVFNHHCSPSCPPVDLHKISPSLCLPQWSHEEKNLERASFRWSDGSTQRLMWSVTFIEVCFFGALKYSPVLFIYKFIQHAYIQQPIYHNSDWKIIKSLVFQWYCSYVYKLFHPSLIIATCDCLNNNILNFSNVQENSWINQCSCAICSFENISMKSVSYTCQIRQFS